jgi:hypothetical protein
LTSNSFLLYQAQDILHNMDILPLLMHILPWEGLCIQEAMAMDITESTTNTRGTNITRDTRGTRDTKSTRATRDSKSGNKLFVI